MKKLLLVLIFVFFGQSLYGQSSIRIGRGSKISVGSGSNVSATNRDGTMMSTGTFNSRAIVFDPVAIAPTSVTGSSFVANWNPSLGAIGYKIDVSTDIAFGSFVPGYQNLDVGNVSSFSVSSGITAGTTYYYRVRAYDIDGITGYSNSITFTTAPLPPIAAAATSVSDIAFSANWGAVAGATKYYLDVATDLSFTSFVTGWSNLDVGNVIAVPVNTNIIGGTTYYYRVRSYNASGTSTSSNTITVLTVPSAPVLSDAAALTQTSFTETWAASTSATKYFLDVATDGSFTTFVTGYNNKDVGNVLTYPVNTSLTAGSTYFSRVRAFNTSGSGPNSNVKSATTVPPDPVATAATDITGISFSAHWNASTSATTYLLDVATDAAFASPVTGWTNVDVGNVTTYPVNTNITAGTTYYYRIRANSASGTSGNSNVVTLVTAPPAPVTVAATGALQTSFSANWNSAAGASKYYLDVSTSNTFSSCVAGWNNLDVGNVTAYAVNTGLAPGTTYYYRVRANNAAGTSVNSNVTTVILIPPDPIATAASAVATTSFTANWNSSLNATGYYLDVATDNTFAAMVAGWSNVSAGNVSSYPVGTGLSAGTTYYYRVRAGNPTGLSGNSGTITVLTAPDVPTASSATALATNSFQAHWNAVAGASGYSLDVSTASGFDAGAFVTGFENLDVSAVTTYSVATSLTAGTTYYYRVRSYNSGGTSGNSNKITLVTLPASPIPSAAASITALGFTANWKSAVSATGYRLDVSTASDYSSYVPGFNNLDVANVLLYPVSGLSANTTYYYRVKAYNDYGTGGNSTNTTVLTAPAAPTTLAASPINSGGFTANWNSTAGAIGYYLDVSTALDFSSYVSGLNSLDVGNVTSYLISGLSPGSTYYYRVRAYNSANPSVDSDVRTVLTLSLGPAASAATAVTTTSFTANWSASVAATGYRMDVASDAAFALILGSYDNIDVGNVTSVSVTGLLAGNTYYYRIRAYNGSGTNGNSNIISVTLVPPAPVERAATSISSNGFNAEWNAANGATGYVLDVATNSGFGAGTFVTGYQDLDVGNVMTYPITGLATGTPYYYRIRAYSPGGPSVWSGTSNPVTAGVAPRAPASIPATSIASTSFDANWAASPGAASYRLDVSTASDFSSFVPAWQNVDVGNVTTYPVTTNLVAGTQYFYRLRAVNASGSSSNSSLIALFTIPLAPVELPAASLNITSFDAQWNVSVGATGYRLDVSTSVDFSSFVPGFNDLDVTNVSSYTITGLASGTRYYYRIRAYNTGGISGPSGTENAVTSVDPGGTVTAIPATSIGETSFSANWNAYPAATGYKLDVATNSGFGAGTFVAGYQDLDVGNVLTFSINTGIAGGTAYYYRVRAHNVDGTIIGNSGTISLSTVPPAPTAIAATSPGETNFVANWNSSTGATGYYLDVATDPAFTSFVTGFQNKYVNSVTTYSVTGLTGGTQYYYQVRAKNGSGVSGNSGTISTVTIPKEPNALAASTVQSTSFTANWDASTGAAKYFLDVSTDPAFGSFVGSWNNTDVGNVTTYTVNTGLSSGTGYYYRVRSSNSGGTSGNSGVISLTTAPAAPTADNATSIGKSTFTANWAASTGATKYFLDVATTNTFDAGSFATGYQNLDVGNSTSAVVNGLALGTTYYYRVRAFNSNGTSVSSATKSALTLPSAPSVLPVTVVSETNFTAAWNGVTGAAKYYLDVSTSSAFLSFVPGWQDVDVGAVTSKSVNTGLSAGTTYYFRVRAYNATGLSDNSETMSTVTAPLAPVAIAASSLGETSFVANWNSSAGAAGYDLDVSTVSDFSSFVPGFSQQDVGNVTSYPVTGLTAGSTYYYRVRSYLGTKHSSVSGTITALALPGAPVATSASTIAATTLSANWSSVVSASGYRLDVATTSGFTSFVAGFNNLDVGNVTTSAVTGLTANTPYYYRVRAYNASGTGSNSNSIPTLTVPGAPVATAASAITNITLTANWNPVVSVTGYRLDVSTDPAFGSFLLGFSDKDVGSVTSYPVTGLNGGLTYYYRVRAYNSSGAGASSGSVTTTTAADPSPAPIATNASAMTQTSFTANWNIAVSAAGYKLDVATDIGFTNYVSGFQDLNVGNVTTYSVTGLAAGTTYYFRTRSYNAAGTSSNSNVKSTPTIPANPTSTAAATVMETSFTANWNASMGANKYYLDVATDAGFTSILAAYDNSDVGNVTSAAISGLAGGTTYYYRLRSYNTSGMSGNSGSITTLTKPAAVVASAATSVTTTGFTANWIAPTGASTYYFDLSTDPAFGSFVPGYDNRDVGNVVALPVSGLSAYTIYYYRVRASNASGSGVNSGTITVVGVPTINAPTSISASGFDADWAAVAGATRYYLDVATDSTFTTYLGGYNNKDVGNVTSASLTGLTTGTTYYYRVRASNATGTSPSSGFKSTITITADPVAIAASSVLSTSFSANWNAVAGAAGYTLSVAIDSPLTTFVTGWENKNIGSATTVSVNTNISGGTAYYYQVRAFNAGGASGYSNIIDVFTLAPVPELNPATAITPSGFTISWSASAGAIKYFLDVASDSTFATFVSGFNNKDVGTVTTYAVTGLPSSTMYYFRVRASNASGTTPSSGFKSAMTSPPGPVTIAATGIGVTNFNANWNPVAGATGYFLDVATDAAFTSILANWQSKDVGNVTTVPVNTSLSSGTTYYFRVRAYNAGGTSYNSNTTSVLTVPSAPALNDGSTVTQSGFTISWSSSVGAAAYHLDVASDYAFTSPISGTNNLDVGSATTYSLTGLSAGTTYYFRIRASNASGTSPNSNIASTVTIPAVPVAAAATGVLSVSFSANWSIVTGAAGYRVDVATDSAFTSFVANWQNRDAGNAATISVNSDIAGGTTYYYRVRAYNASGTSGNSNTTGVLTVLSAPVLNNATAVAQTSFTVGWSSSVGAAKYYLDVATDSMFAAFATGFSNKDIGTATSYSVTGLSTGTVYFVRVRASNANSTSLNSNIKCTITIPANPVTALATNITEKRFNANWNSVAGANGYSLDVATDTACTNLLAGWQNKDVGNVTTVSVDTSIAGGTTYWYRVRAYNASGASGSSNTTNVLTVPSAPALGDASAMTQTGFTISWSSSAGATKYYLDVATDSTFTAYLGGFGNRDVGTVMTYPMTGLSTGTTYFFRVRAYNTSGTSNSSVVRSAHLDAPPELTSMEGTVLNYLEGSTVLMTGTLTVSDVDNSTLASAVVQITGNYVKGEDSLGFSSANGITGVWNSETGRLSLSGSSLVTNYQSALRSVTYQNASQNPSTLQRTMSFTVNDGLYNSLTLARYVTVIPVNNPPVVAGIEPAGSSYAVKQDELQITKTITVQDVDSPNLMSGQVRISGNYVTAEDTLLYDTQNGITGSWVASSGTLMLSGKATTANYQAALRSVRYMNKSVTPTALAREVSFTVNDGEAVSAVMKRTVTISATNAAPLLSGIEPGVLKYTPGSLAVIVSTSIAASDSDNKNLSAAEVKIIQGLIPDEDSLVVTLPPNATARYDSKTGALSISGQNLVSLYGALLQSVKYQNNKGMNARKSLKRVSFAVWDGVAWSSTVTRDIDVEGLVSSVEFLSDEIPKDFILQQNYPNPFNPTTRVQFGIPIESKVTLTIYDMRGRAVRALVQMQLQAGSYTTTWRAAELSSGVYYYHMEATGIGTNRSFTQTKKAILLK